MRIVTVRRISQAFFLLLFLWFCIVSTFGVEWRQLRGWPVNWFLELDPLAAIGTMLTTGALYAGLLWALATVVLTVLLGRFFCGWLCPLGTIHHLTGWLARRGKPLATRAADNQYHPAQALKYHLLFFLLAAAAGALLARAARMALQSGASVLLLGVLTILIFVLARSGHMGKPRKTAVVSLALVSGWTLLAFFHSMEKIIGASLQTGLLDPIPLVYRSVNLVLLPLADATHQKIFITQRYYEGAWLIGAIFLAAVLLNLHTPRFYCRYICPLGALFGVLGRFSVWRVGKNQEECIQCKLCEGHCEGACEPAAKIRLAECVLCMNCLDECKHDLIGYHIFPSASGEITSPDLSRRSFTAALAAGFLAAPMLRLGGLAGPNWNPAVIRPPGALLESDFLARCLKCGQCMRICPTNIIQPASLEAGLEGLWTPILNYRTGVSGCQLNCIAYSHVCPTAALRPISLDEKLGRGAFADAGPIRLGCAFVDQGRCLPWSMDRTCIVCQEICPVSPKAIFVREHFSTLRNGVLRVVRSSATTLEIDGASFRPGQLATGDYYLRLPAEPETERRLITSSADRTLAVEPQKPFEHTVAPGAEVRIQIRLQRPQVDPEHCIGCGVCEHGCPVAGRRAIRVTAENESRNPKHRMLLR